MDEFTAREVSFTYKNGSKCYAGTIEVAPCSLQAAKNGDENCKYAIRSSVARELRMQGSGFMSTVEWRKIKWVE